MTVDTKDAPFSLILFSFGFKYGVPADANMVQDVRFLPNPYWEEHLRHLTGKDKRISDYVLKSEAGIAFLGCLEPLVTLLVQENQRAGKPALRIGIGCTGGHHRSVAVVEHLASLFRREDIALQVEHRDIERE